MDYRYLETRGALNEGAASRGGAARTKAAPPAAAPAAAPSRSRHVSFSSPEVLRLLPLQAVLQHRVVPLSLEGETVYVAAASTHPGLRDRIAALMGRKVVLIETSRAELDAAIARYDREGAWGRETTRSAAPVGGGYGSGDFDLEDGTASGEVASWAGLSSVELGRMLGRSAHRDVRGARAASPPSPVLGLKNGRKGMLTYVVREGERVLMQHPNGAVEEIVGPRRVWAWRRTFTTMAHHVAHPGSYLIVRYRDGRQDHVPGPSQLWADPRVHASIAEQDALQIAAKEAVVVYSGKEGSETLQRRIVHGPALFVPRPGEWLHTFEWHSSTGGHLGSQKQPRGLVFQKLWLLPDQMYHDVPDVRTADDAVLVIRLMLFFELMDINRMLEVTRDPIGDFINAATSDVVDFVGRHDFESFKKHTGELNELAAYRQLVGRAEQCGYRITKVVFRGYGANDRLQHMHDQAIEARTKLQLDRATEEQTQDLEDYRLNSQHARAGHRRIEQGSEVEHELGLERKRREVELEAAERQMAFRREQRRLDEQQRREQRGERARLRREHLAQLREMGVDLTALLTQGRADRVIELRGGNGAAPHVHLDSTDG